MYILTRIIIISIKNCYLNFAVTMLHKAPYKVCIVYDEKMQKHCNISDNTHPEKPTRISSIYNNHEKYGLLERCHLLQV